MVRPFGHRKPVLKGISGVTIWVMFEPIANLKFWLDLLFRRVANLLRVLRGVAYLPSVIPCPEVHWRSRGAVWRDISVAHNSRKTIGHGAGKRSIHRGRSSLVGNVLAENDLKPRGDVGVLFSAG